MATLMDTEVYLPVSSVYFFLIALGFTKNIPKRMVLKGL